MLQQAPQKMASHVCMCGTDVLFTVHNRMTTGLTQSEDVLHWTKSISLIVKEFPALSNLITKPLNISIQIVMNGGLYI